LAGRRADLGVKVAIEQHVGWFDVSVDDVVLVHVS
jgi:hypothetical protein